MSHECTERFNESVFEELEVLFQDDKSNLSFNHQIKLKLYDLLVNDYAEECYYNGVSRMILKLIEGL